MFGDRLLQEDPVLFQLYKDLVVANVITAEEFWANRSTVSFVCNIAERMACGKMQSKSAVEEKCFQLFTEIFSKLLCDHSSDGILHTAELAKLLSP